MRKLFVIILVFFISTGVVKAQGIAQCGSIFEGEFVENNNRHDYFIDLAPGDLLTVSAEVVGQQLDVYLQIYDPTGSRIKSIDSGGGGDREEGNTSVLSTRGTYTVRIAGYNSSDLGIYTLYLGCTLRDGTVIAPGELIDVTPRPPAFSGVGFPGLPPVDFSNVAKVPLSVGVGAVTPTGGEILGFTFDAVGNDVLDLTFTRLSGNLNLGLVVLSAENQVVFQASLVTSQTLNTRFSMPSAGQYTIGVFRIDLLPPATPEATAFQLQGTLNP